MGEVGGDDALEKRSSSKLGIRVIGNYARPRPLLAIRIHPLPRKEAIHGYLGDIKPGVWLGMFLPLSNKR